MMELNQIIPNKIEELQNEIEDLKSKDSVEKKLENKKQKLKEKIAELKNEIFNDIQKLSSKRQEYYYHRIKADLIEEELDK